MMNRSHLVTIFPSVNNDDDDGDDDQIWTDSGCQMRPILRDQGAGSRDDRMFAVKVY